MRSLSVSTDGIRQDLRHAIRGLRRDWTFTALVVATLSFGVGANVALFSLARRLFFQQPAGVAAPSELRRLYARSNWTVGSVTEIRDRFGYPHFEAMQAAIGDRATLVPYTPPDSTPLGKGESIVNVRGVYAGSSYFAALGARPALGRVFLAGEAQLGDGAHVAVLSDRLWRQHFDADPAIIGRVIPLARRQFTVVGVMPREFVGPDLESVDVWMPLSSFPARRIRDRPWYANWQSGFQLRVLARVEPGTTDAWFSGVATAAYRRGELANSGPHADTATILTGPLLRALGPSIRPSPQLAISTRLTGITAIVLIVACANIANLLLTRGSRRRREIAVRLALGVTRSRLVTQLVLEGVLLSVVSAAFAVLLGVVGGDVLQRLVLPPEAVALSPLDFQVLNVALALSLVAGVVASLIPALRVTQPDLSKELKAGGRQGSRDHSRLRVALTVAQTAMSLLLLVGAGLFVRSLSGVRAIDLGMDARRLIGATVHFADPIGHYVDRSARRPEIGGGLRALLPRISSLPGVERAALASAAPLSGFSMVSVYLDGGRPAPRLDDLDPVMTWVSPTYFATVGTPIVRGRGFSESDGQAEAVIIVNETTARAYWPGRDPIGQCIVFAVSTGPCMRVIGISRDANVSDVIEQPKAGLFAPLAQPVMGNVMNPAYLVVRTSTDETRGVVLALRRMLREQFPSAEPPIVRGTAEIVEGQLTSWIVGARLFSWFGGLALVVAAVGVYSVVAYSTSQRMHEMGIRAALGARRSEIVRLVIREGMWPVGLGIGIGIAGALLLARFVESMLYGTSPRDPITLMLAAAVLVTTGLFASALPAWRAAEVDPVVSLRAD